MLKILYNYTYFYDYVLVNFILLNIYVIHFTRVQHVNVWSEKLSFHQHVLHYDFPSSSCFPSLDPTLFHPVIEVFKCITKWYLSCKPHWSLPTLHCLLLCHRIYYYSNSHIYKWMAIIHLHLSIHVYLFSIKELYKYISHTLH